jgi:hypothetical protein
MQILAIRPSGSKTLISSTTARQAIHQYLAIWFLLLTLVPSISQAQTQQPTKSASSEPVPRPAIPAILAAFEKYEVVGMPEAHGLNDLDDFILALIRNPEFPEKLNDIAVECRNSLYQPILDRYISGEDVPFSEVRDVWRNTTQPMCGESEFFEELFPLVRKTNQKLASTRRLRVLAGDSPVDWNKVSNIKDAPKEYFDRDGSIASVIKNEVLSRHRKALMLFGTFHLMHGGHNAVGTYEMDYPNATFVISDLMFFNPDLASRNPFADWPRQHR